MNAYEARQEARRERLLAIAAKLEREGNARYSRARELASLIPMGQPILVGHYSERGDRAFRNRINNMTTRGFADMAAAEKMRAKAEAVGSGGISSDDPEAINKLREQLAGIEKAQRDMKRANLAIRRNAKEGEAAQLAALVELGYSEAMGLQMLKPDFCGRVGFPGYALSNNNANARRIRERIAQLEQRAAAAAQNPEPVEQVIGGVRMVEDIEDNRLRLFFDGKPTEAVRDTLKRNGFRWSPTSGAWQRQLSNGAKYAAQCVLQKIGGAQ